MQRASGGTKVDLGTMANTRISLNCSSRQYIDVELYVEEEEPFNQQCLKGCY